MEVRKAIALAAVAALALSIGVLGISCGKRDQPAPEGSVRTSPESVDPFEAKYRCRSNIKRLGLSARLYTFDHDGRLPDADRWVDELTPYVKDTDTFVCPADQSGARCSYAMNADLSGQILEDITDPESTVLFYETQHPGDNPSGSPADVPTPPRHEGGNNYAYADGQSGTR